MRLTVRKLLDLTVSNELHPLVRKRLTEVVQLLQVYCRLAELEINAGERPSAGDVVLPEHTAEKAKEWAEREGEKSRIMEGIAAFNKDPVGTLKKMG